MEKDLTIAAINFLNQLPSKDMEDEFQNHFVERRKYDSELESFDSEMLCVDYKIFTLSFGDIDEQKNVS